MQVKKLTVEDLRRLTIFTGNLGSGKTELALNFSLHLKKRGLPVSVVDLDVVNPYFRTRLKRAELENKGVAVICPQGEWSAADLPALSPAVRGVLEDERRYGVFDVGGDDVGATVLGRFKPYFSGGDYHLWFVVNACRPFTRDVRGIVTVLRSIEKASRLTITGLVSNTNLGRDTDLETVLEGHRVVVEAARRLSLPVALAGARRELAGELQHKLDGEIPVLSLELYMQPPWVPE